MKTVMAFPLFLLAAFSAPAMAETAAAAVSAETCKLIGPLEETSEDCKALRAAFRVEVNICMARLRDQAYRSHGAFVRENAHTSRSRFLICDKATRAKMAALVN